MIEKLGKEKYLIFKDIINSQIKNNQIKRTSEADYSIAKNFISAFNKNNNDTDSEEYDDTSLQKKYVELNISKLDLIRLIIDLRIKDLKVVEKLYHLFEIPFNYEKKKVNIGDIYDECLKTFIENDVYTGSLPDDFTYQNKVIEIDNNHLKYENILKNVIYSNWLNTDTYEDNYNNFLFNLYLKVEHNIDLNDNLIDSLYFDNQENEELREYIGEYEDNNSSYPLTNAEFINIMLLTFFDNYYETKKDNIKQLRRIIEDIPRNIYKRLFIDKIYVEDIFSYNRFENFYRYIFIKEDEKLNEERATVFYSLFVNIINKIIHTKLEIPFKIQSLTKEEITIRLMKIKNNIDMKLSMKK